MKAEATTTAAHDQRAAASRAHSGSVLGEPPAAKAHVRALLEHARLQASDERPRWRPNSATTTATAPLYEPKREPSDSYDLHAHYDDRHYANYDSYDSYDDRRASERHTEDAYRPRYDYDYDADRHRAYKEPTQAWGGARPFAYRAEPPSAAYAQASPPRMEHAPRRSSADHVLPPSAPPPAAPYYQDDDLHHHYQPQQQHYQQQHYQQQHYRQRSHFEREQYTSTSTAAITTTRRHQYNEADDLDDSDGRVVVHLQEPRSPPSHHHHRHHRHPLKSHRQESSSHRSTSNSSVQSATSIDREALDDDEYEELHHRGVVHQDASEEEDADDSDEYVYEPSTRTENLSHLTPDVYEDNELHSDFRHMLHMLIPTNAFGCLVGNRGAIIRKINAQTGCTLSIRDGSAFSLEDDTEHRVLRIYGSPKGICLAQHLVIAKIRAHRAKKLDPLYTPLTLHSDDVLMPLPDTSVSRSLRSVVIAAPKQKRGASTNTVDASTTQDAGTAFGSVKWLLRSDDVGRIMGTNGAIMRAIARDTNTMIHVTPTVDMPRGSKERLVTILGPSSADFEAARAEIERLAGGRAESQALDSKDSQYFAIPSVAVGALIGPHGKTSRWITEQSGARVQIPQSEHLPLGHVNRVLHMQGTRKQVEHAYTLVRAKIRKELERLAVEDDEDDENDSSYVAMKIMIPTRIAVLMLNQRGRLVQEISEKSGAHAHFLPSHDDELRICLIAGALTPALRAERLILQLVAGDMIATKRSGVGGSRSGVLPREKRKRNAADDKMDERDDDDDDDDDDGDGDARRTTRGAQRLTVVRGGHPNPRNNSGRRGAAPRDNRRTQSTTRANGKQSERSSGGRAGQRAPGRNARAPRKDEEKPDIMDRLQAPLQSARHVGANNKRQRC